MDCRPALRWLIPAAVLLLAACASTPPEVGAPEVVPQPQAKTTTEAVAEGQAAEAQFEAQRQAEVQAALSEEPPPGSKSAPDPADAATAPATSGPPVAKARRTERYRPTELSVVEVRELNAAAVPPQGFDEHLDHAHDQFYTWTQGMVEATDHRYAPKDAEPKPVPAAPFRIGLVLESIDRSDGLELNLDADVDIALHLPNLEDRLKIFITSDELDESPRDARDDTRVSAGVRYRFLKYLDFDVGVKLDIPPVAFTSLKWSTEVPFGEYWSFYPLAKLFADSDEGVGYAAAATFDHWKGRNLLRSSSYVKWRSDRDHNEWSQTFIYARTHQLIVPDRYGSYLKAKDIGRGWGVRLLASSEDESAINYYEVGVFYRRPTRNRWLYLFVEPLVRWDREYAWEADVGIRIGIDALFWDLARPAR